MKTMLAQLMEGEALSAEQSERAFELIMTGEATPAQTASLLTMLAYREPTIDEITGAVRVMRRKASKVQVPDGLTVIDTCGTGGDGAGTFNISTAAAIVAAAAGRPHGMAVAKHGNKSVTSNSGSSQVLEALGVTLQVSNETLTRCLGEAGICFCFAPSHHPAMKHAGPVRGELGFRTIFNLVGPLTNPAGASRQLMGVFAPQLLPKLAGVFQNLGAEHAMVVHGQLPAEDTHSTGGLDELSTSGPSQGVEIIAGEATRFEIDPMELELSFSHPSSMRVDSSAKSAEIIRQVLGGRHGPARDIVALNAAAALVVADLAESLRAGLDLAVEAIDTGAAQQTLDTLVRLTGEAG